MSTGAIANAGGTEIKYIDTQTGVDLTWVGNLLGAYINQEVSGAVAVGLILSRHGTTFVTFYPVQMGSTITIGTGGGTKYNIRVFYFWATDALSSSSLPSVTEDDNGSSLIAYNGQWIVINNGKIFQYNISNSCPSVWNNRSGGWSNKPLSVNLDSKYSYITLDSSTDFKIIGSSSNDDTNGSLSFPVSATCTKGNSRTIGPSSLSYIYGCYATLSFTSDNIVELQFGFSSAEQRSGLGFYSTGALIFRAYV